MADDTYLPDVEDQEALGRAHARALGARLRVIRHQVGLSLEDVEGVSDGEFQASVLDAYERGDQAIPFHLFRRLVKLYGASPDQLLPQAWATTPVPGAPHHPQVDETVLPPATPQDRRVGRSRGRASRSREDQGSEPHRTRPRASVSLEDPGTTPGFERTRHRYPSQGPAGDVVWSFSPGDLGSSSSTNTPIEAEQGRGPSSRPKAPAGHQGKLTLDIHRARDGVDVGTPVMVRTRYLGSWATGYEVAEVLDDGYRLRRLSDGSVLPDVIAFDDVRR
jgi:transcriptional regulator with XRE-family HTH domain